MKPTAFHRVFPWLLAAVAALLWLPAAFQLRAGGHLEFTPNPGSIGSSPYGKTLGLAIQGPIDVVWHVGQNEDPFDHHHHHDGAAEHAEEHDCCPHCDSKAARSDSSPHLPGPIASAHHWLEDLQHASRRRTSEFAPVGLHRIHLRREVERKLRFAYWLDPTNFSNYNALFLFLTEQSLTERDSDLAAVLELADQTREIVEREQANPEPWLTAAATHLAHLEIAYRLKDQQAPDYETIQYHLEGMASSLNRFAFLRDFLQTSGGWELIPAVRRADMEERHSLFRRFLEAQQAIYANHFGDESSTPAQPES